MGSRVLLVGAYERDNFGDLLFLLLTQSYFRSASVVASAPMAADMSLLVDQRIVAYGPLLRQQKFDHIWTVGGEVGGVTPESAFRMSAAQDLLRSFATSGNRQQVLTAAFGGPLLESPYIPRPTAYPKNAMATLGVNSVGLKGMDRLPSPLKSSLLSTLRMAGPVSVRDEASSAYLAEQGISHSLVPDLVHSIALTRPRELVDDSNYILVQAGERHLRAIGEEEFAKSIAELGHREKLEIRFFVAGTANGHDSVASYERLVTSVSRIDPSVMVSVSSARRPWDRVDEIQRARLWIGTSLHGRIVATAYGVPRVSLDVPKVNRYAATWDSDMPYSVHAHELVDASASALVMGRGRALLDRGRALGELADSHMRTSVTSTLAGDFDPTVEERFASLESMRLSDASLSQREQPFGIKGSFMASIRRKSRQRTSPGLRRAARGALGWVGRPRRN